MVEYNQRNECKDQNNCNDQGQVLTERQKYCRDRNKLQVAFCETKDRNQK